MTKKLLALGASLSCRCKWTDMAALHYASYFDVGPVLTALLITSKVNFMSSVNVFNIVICIHLHILIITFIDFS